MAEILPIPVLPSLPMATAVPPPADGLRRVAQEFETAFLAEMLAHSGVGRMPEGLNGGAGESQFASLLTREYAAEIARSGKLRLAEQIWQSLVGAVR